MPAYQVDLHNHTPLIPCDYRGDAKTTVREIVVAALDAGLDAFAVTDHYSVGLVPEFIKAADEVAEEIGRRLLVVPGAELGLGFDGDEARVVALFGPDGYVEGFSRLFASIGFDPDAVACEDLPALLVDADPMSVCGLVRSLGGVALLAHVDRAFGDYRLVDSDLLYSLLDSHVVDAVELLDVDRYAPSFSHRGIAILANSDSHSVSEIGRRRSYAAMEDLSFDSLKLSIQRAATVAVA